uniref:Uncharacterized protein n=1 Tax=Panagrellus redivivus TaxID=6233 RepID=A0A7E4V6U3_PANRE
MPSTIQSFVQPNCRVTFIACGYERVFIYPDVFHAFALFLNGTFDLVHIIVVISVHSRALVCTASGYGVSPMAAESRLLLLASCMLKPSPIYPHQVYDVSTMFTPNTIGAMHLGSVNEAKSLLTLTCFNLRSSEPALPGSLLSLRTSSCLVHPNIGPSLVHRNNGFDLFDDEWTVDSTPKPLTPFDESLSTASGLDSGFACVSCAFRDSTSHQISPLILALNGSTLMMIKSGNPVNPCLFCRLQSDFFTSPSPQQLPSLY